VAGDEARRLPLHHQELRVRRAAVARAQRMASARNLNRQSDHAQRPSRRAERIASFHLGPSKTDPRHRPSSFTKVAKLSATVLILGRGAAPARSCWARLAAPRVGTGATAAVHRREPLGDSARSSSRARSFGHERGAFTGRDEAAARKIRARRGRHALSSTKSGILRLDLQAKAAARDSGRRDRGASAAPSRFARTFRLVVREPTSISRRR